MSTVMSREECTNAAVRLLDDHPNLHHSLLLNIIVMSVQAITTFTLMAPKGAPSITNPIVDQRTPNTFERKRVRCNAEARSRNSPHSRNTGVPVLLAAALGRRVAVVAAYAIVRGRVAADAVAARLLRRVDLVGSKDLLQLLRFFRVRELVCGEGARFEQDSSGVSLTRWTSALSCLCSVGRLETMPLRRAVMAREVVMKRIFWARRVV